MADSLIHGIIDAVVRLAEDMIANAFCLKLSPVGFRNLYGMVAAGTVDDPIFDFCIGLRQHGFNGVPEGFLAVVGHGDDTDGGIGGYLLLLMTVLVALAALAAFTQFMIDYQRTKCFSCKSSRLTRKVKRQSYKRIHPCRMVHASPGSFRQFEDHIRRAAAGIVLWQEQSALPTFDQIPQVFRQMIDMKHAAFIMIGREQGKLLCQLYQGLIIALAAGTVDHRET